MTESRNVWPGVSAQDAQRASESDASAQEVFDASWKEARAAVLRDRVRRRRVMGFRHPSHSSEEG